MRILVRPLQANELGLLPQRGAVLKKFPGMSVARRKHLFVQIADCLGTESRRLQSKHQRFATKHLVVRRIRIQASVLLQLCYNWMVFFLPCD